MWQSTGDKGYVTWSVLQSVGLEGGHRQPLTTGEILLSVPIRGQQRTRLLHHYNSFYMKFSIYLDKGSVIRSFLKFPQDISHLEFP